MNLADRLSHYKELRAEGFTPQYAAARAAYEYRPPAAYAVAAERCRSRATLLTGMRDTWRLAYSVARLEGRHVVRNH